MNILLIAIGSIALSVMAQFSLKAGMSSAAVRAALSNADYVQSGIAISTNKFVLLGFLLYGVGAVVWLAVLSSWEVSKAYPLVGLGFALSLIIGVFLGEQVSAPRVFGALLICAGVFVVSRS
jgi:drug/metabolite transporter (DMT)-like permease